MPDEAALIAAAQNGSVSAFTDLVGRYREGLLRFLILRSANRADAEDVLQDTLLNAFRYLQTYDKRWRFSTWLYRIAIRKLAGKSSVGGTTEIETVAGGEDPLARCIADSARENLWSTARRSLSEEVYTAMWLRYVEDASVNDIARVLERSVSWTKVNLMRGRKRLERAMNSDLESEGNKAYG